MAYFCGRKGREKEEEKDTPYYVSFGFITNFNNNPFSVTSQIVPALNVLINKWSNNGELTVTVVQCGKLIIMASTVIINFHIVAKVNLGIPLELKTLCTQM